VLAKILSEENDSYQVEDAEDGILGFEKIKNDYDLVLCDIKCPNGKLLEAKKNKTRNSNCNDLWSWRHGNLLIPCV
jgi:CheY-like chemotaxis protein